jgi:uncharacterized protein (UPF0332 family)
VSIDAEDLLSIAEELSESTNEVKIRTSLGRSYYSAYHMGLEYFDITDTKNWFGGKGGVHQKLIDEFMYNSQKPVAYMLINLKTKRHLADYHLSVDIGQEDAKASIKSVKLLKEKIK